MNMSVFLPYQAAWLRDHSQIKIWEKSRRIGATWTQAFEDVEDAVLQREYTPGRPVKKIYFATKDEEAGKEYIEYCLMWAKIYNVVLDDLGEKIIEEEDNKKVKARILEFENGSRIISLSSAPTAFNSKGGKIVWDEAALHKDQRQMWSGAQPAAFVWGYPIRILSTHKGKSTLFFRFCDNAKKGKNDFSLHRVTIVDAVNDGLYDRVVGRKTNRSERETYIARIRSSCQSEDIFQEDYMANPVDATTAYFTYDEIDFCTVDNITRTIDYLRECKNPLYLGYDVGRKRDLGIIPIGEYIKPVLFTRFIAIFDRERFEVQERFLDDAMRLPTMMRGCIDATGMGLPLSETAQRKHGAYRVEAITFTNAVKEMLAVGVKQMFEDRHILIPDDDQLRESIHSIKRMVTAAGNIRFDAERTDQTGHADHFWGLALMAHAQTGGPSGPTWAESVPVTRTGAADKYCDKINYSQFS